MNSRCDNRREDVADMRCHPSGCSFQTEAVANKTDRVYAASPAAECWRSLGNNIITWHGIIMWNGITINNGIIASPLSAVHRGQWYHEGRLVCTRDVSLAFV